MTYPVSLVKIDVMISPFRFDFVSIKSLPHRAVGVSLFWCCCCYSRCCCCFSRCVIIFVRSLILLSLLSVVVACLFLVVVAGTYLLYTIVCLVATLGDRTLSWVRVDWCFVLITGITRTSFVVPRKLLSFSCCATPLLFLLFDAVDLRCPLALSALFADALKNYRFGGSWLICSWKLSRLPWHFLCFAELWPRIAANSGSIL